MVDSIYVVKGKLFKTPSIFPKTFVNFNFSFPLPNTIPYNPTYTCSFSLSCNTACSPCSFFLQQVLSLPPPQPSYFSFFLQPQPNLFSFLSPTGVEPFWLVVVVDLVADDERHIVIDGVPVLTRARGW